jgi:Trehalase
MRDAKAASAEQSGRGEYPLQVGFGWTNGVLTKLMAEYPDLALHALRQSPRGRRRPKAIRQAEKRGTSLAVVRLIGRGDKAPEPRQRIMCPRKD